MCDHCMNRREFTGLAVAGAAGAVGGLASILRADGPAAEPWDPDNPPRVTGKPLSAQPLLDYLEAKFYPLYGVS